MPLNDSRVIVRGVLEAPLGFAPTLADRRAEGQELRHAVPRGRHAEWAPRPGRRDPLAVIAEDDQHRLPGLIASRHARMRASPFAFLRGAACVMAEDLAATPISGLRVQACGDCHHANFATCVSPDGTVAHDITDYDETLPAPFEWDLKRLATGFAVDALCRGLPERTAKALARGAAEAYRAHVIALARRDPIGTWSSVVNAAGQLGAIEDGKLADRERRRLAAVVEASRNGWPKLLERRGGTWRLRDRAPHIRRLDPATDDAHYGAALSGFASYRDNLPEELSLFFAHYRLRDVGLRAAGIGALGMVCAIGLFTTPEGDPLLLQLREARTSVLAPFAGRSLYANQGKRVVTGQRIMHVVPDRFLGWTQDPGDDRHCFVRGLTDAPEELGPGAMPDGLLAHYAVLCGRALALAHARGGDAVRLAGYLGTGGAMDAAVAEFAMAYAAQTTRDWRLFDAAMAE